MLFLFCVYCSRYKLSLGIITFNLLFVKRFWLTNNLWFYKNVTNLYFYLITSSFIFDYLSYIQLLEGLVIEVATSFEVSCLVNLLFRKFSVYNYVAFLHHSVIFHYIKCVYRVFPFQDSDHFVCLSTQHCNAWLVHCSVG